MNTTFRNIHVKAPAPAALDQTSRLLPRLRVVTNDPAREYAQRPGTVEKLPDSVAALILAKQGFKKVTRAGIVIELDGRELKFWSENSVTIATKAGTNEKVLWTLNRQQPDVLHILAADGEYIESIPRDGKADPINGDFRLLAAKKRANQRRMDRIAHLHQPDSRAALERETDNEGKLKGLVQTFPANDRNTSPGRETRPTTNFPANDRLTTPHVAGRGRIPKEQPIARRENLSPSSFPRAHRLHEIQRDFEQARVASEERQQESARRVAAVTPEDLNDLLGDEDENDTFLTSSPDREVEAALTATESPAEDESDWIL